MRMRTAATTAPASSVIATMRMSARLIPLFSAWRRDASRKICARPFARQKRACMKILLAVDGSPHSLDTVKSVIAHADWYRDKPAIELITVHRPVPRIGGLGAAVSKAQIERYYEEEGEKALGAAKKALDSA